MNMRGDGRANDEHREVIIKQGNLRQANGSSFVTLNDNSLNIYTGIKVEIGDTTNDEGQIHLKIESAQRAEKNRDSESHINSDKNTLSYIETILNSYLIENINKKPLCISQGKKCWILNIDVFILENIEMAFLNLIAAGIGAALENLVLPKVEIAHNNLTNEDEITLIEEQFQQLSIQKDYLMPDIFLIGQVNRTLILDLTIEEFYSVENKYIVVVDPYEKKIIAIKKTGAGFLTPDDFAKIVQFAIKASFNHANK